MTVAMSANGGRFPFGKEGTDSDETPESRHLRDNSRYLIQNGLPSVVSAAAVYMRGIVMNLLVVLPILVAASIVLVWLHELLLWLKAEMLPAEGQGTLLYPVALSLLLGAVFFAAWAFYAMAVSVLPIASLRRRQLLAWTAAMVLSALVLLVIAELHVWLLDVSFPKAATYIQNTTLSLSALALAALPFVKRLASMATKGTEDAGWSDFAKRLLSSAMLLLIAAIVPFGLWLATMLLAKSGLSSFKCDAWWTSFFYVATAAGLFLTWPFLSVNANSLHQLYRDRLGSAFLMRRKMQGEVIDPKQKVVKQYEVRSEDGKTTKAVDLVSADDFRLHEVKLKFTPYHLINAALNVPGSKFANMRGRNADFFVFSPCFIGSELTGYIDTKIAEDRIKRLNIGTAMAISGAAVSPNMGMATMKPLSPTIAFLNVRLGRWIPHPDWIARRAEEIRTGRGNTLYRRWRFRYPRPRYLLREAFTKTGVKLWRGKARNVEPKGFLFLTDGGHIENLGVYELLRRRCKLIIAVDAEADPTIGCQSLLQLERFARIDLDTRITIDWQPIGARTRKVAELVKTRTVSYAPGPHIALGTIDYPKRGDGKPEQGLLIYIKASLSGDENDYIMGYKAQYPSFPHETTADQIFSEEQLEVYRALGEHITRHFLDNKDRVSAFESDREKINALVHEFLPAVVPDYVEDSGQSIPQRVPPHPSAGTA